MRSLVQIRVGPQNRLFTSVETYPVSLSSPVDPLSEATLLTTKAQPRPPTHLPNAEKVQIQVGPQDRLFRRPEATAFRSPTACSISCRRLQATPPNAVNRVIVTTGVLSAGTDDCLDVPSSVAFGTGPGGKQTLYAVNMALTPGLGTGIGSALVVIDAGVPGLPAP